MLSDDELPELPSLNIPTVGYEFEELQTPPSSLRSNFAEQSAERLELLRQGQKHAHNLWQTVTWTANSSETRTSDMASRLASNFYRTQVPSGLVGATKWDICMWADLARLLKDQVKGSVDPYHLPESIYKAFSFLERNDLEERVVSLVEWSASPLHSQRPPRNQPEMAQTRPTGSVPNSPTPQHLSSSYGFYGAAGTTSTYSSRPGTATNYGGVFEAPYTPPTKLSRR